MEGHVCVMGAEPVGRLRESQSTARLDGLDAQLVH